jgi:hypothetical protein
MSLANMFKDAKGDWNLAECVGMPAAAIGVAMWVWKAAHHVEVPDLQSFGLGLGAVITALGAAQRLRGDADIDRDKDHDRTS